MAKEPSLKERVTILEERLKLYAPLPDHKLALADSTAQLRCAKKQSARYLWWSRFFCFGIVAFWLVVDLVLALR